MRILYLVIVILDVTANISLIMLQNFKFHEHSVVVVSLTTSNVDLLKRQKIGFKIKPTLHKIYYHKHFWNYWFEMEIGLPSVYRIHYTITRFVNELTEY